jgi:hypothetical protein
MTFEDKLRARVVTHPPQSFIRMKETERDALADAIEALREDEMLLNALVHSPGFAKFSSQAIRDRLHAAAALSTLALARLDAGGQAEPSVEEQWLAAQHDPGHSLYGKSLAEAKEGVTDE